MEKNYPYKLGESLNYATIPYLIKKDEFDYINKGFCNCVESVLYHFLNCLLWNGKEYVNIKEHCLLTNIFNGENLKHSPSKSEMLDWHKYVENIEPNILYDDALNISKQEMRGNPFNYVYYKVEKNKIKNQLNTGIKNELKSGLITLLKVLEHLSGKSLTNELKATLKAINWNITKDNIKLIEDCIRDAFIKFLGVDPKNIDMTFKDIEYIKIGNKYDIFGLINK